MGLFDDQEDKYGEFSIGDVVAIRGRRGRYKVADIRRWGQGDRAKVEFHVDKIEMTPQEKHEAIELPEDQEPLAGGRCSASDVESVSEHELRVCAELRRRGGKIAITDYGDRVLDAENWKRKP